LPHGENHAENNPSDIVSDADSLRTALRAENNPLEDSLSHEQT
jgi:hypothetical protein